MDVCEALESTSVSMLGLNTMRLINAGLAAPPDKIPEARQVGRSFFYGSQMGAQNVHVMAGKTAGSSAETTYLENLRYASEIASRHDMSVLIEPSTLRYAGIF